ncbi:unnamed protein product [Didymodactylos carnosus]|uniref:RING-type domain-containing protein n=1 Tax=Didymodactylos carnosus TaxID=1234261 RepID=A0A8S2PY64_9BILA|nr:unnamed protein product [Didymodactylos carnosus]CAF4071066.1 unnamed protein product [Didymodactylos carnosus]
MTAIDDDFESITRCFDANALLHCPICKKDFNDPRILCSNGHTFCHHCIEDSLQDDGLIECPVCHDTKRLASVHDVSQLPKNHTVLTLKNAEHHRLAQLGICELCNKKMSYGRCYHCRKLACFKCMHEHEQIIEHEQEKEYNELVHLKEHILNKIDHFEKSFEESKNNVKQLVHQDAEKQVKELKEREQALNAQIDDLYQNHSTSSHQKLQKLKHEVEKDSHELDKIDLKKWNSTDRYRLTKHWNDIQRQLDVQHVEFTYKPLATVNNRLGEIHFKQNQDMITTQARTPHQLVRINPNVFNSRGESDRDQLSRETASLFLHREGLINNGPSENSSLVAGGKWNTMSGRESKTSTMKRMVVTERGTPGLQLFPHDTEGGYRGQGYSVKFSTKLDGGGTGGGSRSRSRIDDHLVDVEQEGNEYAVRKVVRTHNTTSHGTHSNHTDHSTNFQDDIPLTPRMPVTQINLHEYSKKASHVINGVNESDKFSAPKAIVVTDTDQLIIADTKKHRLIVFDLIMKSVRVIKGFLFPDGLCLAGEQYVIITDRHRVSKYDWYNGKLLSSIGSKKEGCTNTSFSWPKGVAIDNNSIFVCDSYNSRMVALTHQMHYQSAWTVMRGMDFLTMKILNEI